MAVPGSQGLRVPGRLRLVSSHKITKAPGGSTQQIHSGLQSWHLRSCEARGEALNPATAIWRRWRCFFSRIRGANWTPFVSIPSKKIVIFQTIATDLHNPQIPSWPHLTCTKHRPKPPGHLFPHLQRCPALAQRPRAPISWLRRQSAEPARGWAP